MEEHDQTEDVTINVEKAKEPSGASSSSSEVAAKPKAHQLPPAAFAGLLQACGTELSEVERDLRELTGKQAEMIDKVGEHNRLLDSNPEIAELKSLMDNMKEGLEKLSLVRQEMSSIHERSEKLKERAERLANLRRAAERKEEDLVAQLGTDEEPPLPKDASLASSPR